jgi:hypothetical protein
MDARRDQFAKRTGSRTICTRGLPALKSLTSGPSSDGACAVCFAGRSNRCALASVFDGRSGASTSPVPCSRSSCATLSHVARSTIGACCSASNFAIHGYLRFRRRHFVVTSNAKLQLALKRLEHRGAGVRVLKTPSTSPSSKATHTRDGSIADGPTRGALSSGQDQVGEFVSQRWAISE